jgi:3D (Asp-Asp-Asp) domain-containing protein
LPEKIELRGRERVSKTSGGRKLINVAGIGLAAGSICLGACTARPPAPGPLPPPAAKVEPPSVTAQGFEATAYSLDGLTRSGRPVERGLVAADPKVLPLGSRIRVDGAGQYSGVYTVADTGRSIDGREIDIYIADEAEATRFGRRQVKVTVLERGSR